MCGTRIFSTRQAGWKKWPRTSYWKIPSTAWVCLDVFTVLECFCKHTGLCKSSRLLYATEWPALKVNNRRSEPGDCQQGTVTPTSGCWSGRCVTGSKAVFFGIIDILQRISTIPAGRPRGTPQPGRQWGGGECLRPLSPALTGAESMFPTARLRDAFPTGPSQAKPGSGQTHQRDLTAVAPLGAGGGRADGRRSRPTNACGGTVWYRDITRLPGDTGWHNIHPQPPRFPWAGTKHGALPIKILLRLQRGAKHGWSEASESCCSLLRRGVSFPRAPRALGAYL